MASAGGKAAPISRGVASERASFVTGAAFNIEGGFRIRDQ